MLVSNERRFNKYPTKERCRQWIKVQKIAKKYANYIIKYENFSNDLENTISIISQRLNIRVNPIDRIKKLPSVYVDGRTRTVCDKKTLLNGGHSTGTYPGEWRKELPDKLKLEINTEFKWWFEENGYEPE